MGPRNSKPAPRVLFLCTGNSCRSQMAEALARARWGDLIEACSAGTRPQGVNRLALRAIAELESEFGSEVGIAMERQTSKHIDAFRSTPIDLVVTVCDAARGACPVFPGAARVLHQPFDDPPALAAGAASDVDAMPHYRRVRDEIRAFIETLPSYLPASTR